MASYTNPYRTPQPTPGSDRKDAKPLSHFGIVVWLLVYLYPVWIAGSFYSTWLIAWVELGHRPRPMLDDPKYIGGLMDYVYPLPALTLMALPVLAPLGMASSFFTPFRGVRRRRITLSVVLAVLHVGIWTLSIWGLRNDPFRVADWWFD